MTLCVYILSYNLQLNNYGSSYDLSTLKTKEEVQYLNLRNEKLEILSFREEIINEFEIFFAKYVYVNKIYHTKDLSPLDKLFCKEVLWGIIKLKRKEFVKLTKQYSLILKIERRYPYYKFSKDFDEFFLLNLNQQINEQFFIKFKEYMAIKQNEIVENVLN